MLVNQYSNYVVAKILHLLTILERHFSAFSLTTIRRCQSFVQPRVPHRTIQTEKSCDTSFKGKIGVALQEIITKLISDICHCTSSEGHLCLFKFQLIREPLMFGCIVFYLTIQTTSGMRFQRGSVLTPPHLVFLGDTVGDTRV